MGTMQSMILWMSAVEWASAHTTLPSTHTLRRAFWAWTCPHTFLLLLSCGAGEAFGCPDGRGCTAQSENFCLALLPGANTRFLQTADMS